MHGVSTRRPVGFSKDHVLDCLAPLGSQRAVKQRAMQQGLNEPPTMRRRCTATGLHVRRRLVAGRSLAVVLLLLVSSCSQAEGHGYIKVPAARNWLHAHTHNFYDEMSLDRAGVGVINPGVCGGQFAYNGSYGVRDGTVAQSNTDMRFHVAPLDTTNPDAGIFATGNITGNFKQGQVVAITLVITAWHWGRFEYRLCPLSDPSLQAERDELSEACLAGNSLLLADTGEPYYYFNWDEYNSYQAHGSVEFTTNWALPAGVTCDRCVMQWRWVTGNSCYAPGTNVTFVNTYSPNLPACDPATYQDYNGAIPEHFYNCADIRINADSGGGTPSSPPPFSSAVPSPPPPASPPPAAKAPASPPPLSSPPPTLPPPAPRMAPAYPPPAGQPASTPSPPPAVAVAPPPTPTSVTLQQPPVLVVSPTPKPTSIAMPPPFAFAPPPIIVSRPPTDPALPPTGGTPAPTGNPTAKPTTSPTLPPTAAPTTGPTAAPVTTAPTVTKTAASRKTTKKTERKTTTTTATSNPRTKPKTLKKKTTVKRTTAHKKTVTKKTTHKKKTKKTTHRKVTAHAAKKKTTKKTSKKH